MLDELRRRPWTVRRHASLLARLHERLHEIAAPPLLSPDGPFVIDWANARRGDSALDVALTWVIAATSGGRLAPLFLRWFLPHFDRDDLCARSRLLLNGASPM